MLYVGRMLALLASLALHAILLIPWQAGLPQSSTHPATASRVMHISFSAPAKAVQVVDKQQKPVIHHVVKHHSEPVSPHTQHVNPKIVKSQPVKSPVLLKAAQAKPQAVMPRVLHSKHMLAKQHMDVASPAKAAAVDQGILEDARQHYLADVMAHVEQHKWYPKAAKRRGIWGKVEVSFVLLPNGLIGQLMVKGGPDILCKAAAKSIKKALPMPKPASKLPLPLHCKFFMQFSII